MNEYHCWWEEDGPNWGYQIDAESEKEAALKYIKDYELEVTPEVLIVQQWLSASGQAVNKAVRFIVAINIIAEDDGVEPQPH